MGLRRFHWKKNIRTRKLFHTFSDQKVVFVFNLNINLVIIISLELSDIIWEIIFKKGEGEKFLKKMYRHFNFQHSTLMF